MSTAELVIEALGTVATTAVAALAIWSEKARAIFASPKLEICRHNLRGHAAQLVHAGVINAGGPLASFYYHLKVVNVRPWLVVRECRVLLVGMERRGPDNEFHPIEFPVPLQFIWAPELAGETYVTVTKERVFDFGRIIKGQKGFEPRLTTYPISFSGLVKSGEAVRYHIEIDAANYAPRCHTIMQVAWDGEWADTAEKMEPHLRISEIAGSSIAAPTTFP
jgi:hypothetical protein